MEYEIDEVERVVDELYPKASHVLKQKNIHKISKLIESAKLVTLSKTIWSNLENTDSYEIESGDMSAVKKLAKLYEKDYASTIKKIKNGDAIEASIIMHKPDGKYTLVAGNTRLMIFKAMNITPKVVIVNWNE